MKKILLTLALALTCCWASATNADDLFNKYKDAENAQYMNLPQEMLKMAMAQNPNASDNKVAEKISSLDILQFEKPDDATITQVMDMVNDFDDTYEELIRNNGDGETVIIKMKRNGENYSEMVVFQADADECAVVRMCGNFNPEELNELSKMGR